MNMDIQQLINFDQELLLKMNGSNSLFWDGFMWVATSTYIWIPVGIILLYVIFKNNKIKEAFLIIGLLAIVVALADQISSGFCKPFFARFRPTQDPILMYMTDIVNGYRGGRYGFISSHAANTFAVAVFISLIVKNVSLGRNTTYIGEKYISIGDNTSIGDNGRLTAYGYYEKTKQHFTPLLTIGNNCNIGEQSHITAINCIMIGNNVLTGPRVLITDNAHGDSLFKLLDTAPTERFLYSKGKVVIEDNVWIAEGAMIMPGVRIGKGSIIAANSVVTKDIPSYSVAAGTPAKIIKTMK